MDPRIKRLEPLFFFLLYVAVGLCFLRVLTDWVSFIVDEGFTSYGAQRLREGQLPHRDFFFLWTPGILAWHALLQSLGCSWLGERASALLAAAFTGTLILMQAKEWNVGASQRLVLAGGILLWGFSLWNIPYSSWYALPFALLGARFNSSRPILAGLCFALAFWFKQNIGILAFVGAIAAMGIVGEKRAVVRVGAAFLIALLIPFAGFAVTGGFSQAFSQIFLFPLKYPGLMSEFPPKEWLAAPLMLLGLWILGMFSLQPHITGNVPRFLRAAMVLFFVYACVMKGQSFMLGSFILFSCLAWGLGLALALTDLTPAERPRFWLFFLPTFGAFLQVFPRVDFQHFLFVFPPSFFLLVWGLGRIRDRYPWLKGGILFLPIAVLAWGGISFQSRLISLYTYGQKDSFGLISYGWAHRVNEEMQSVITTLKSQGLKPGDPVLVLPNATTFYRLSGFRNITPHDQFFPGYVEGFGSEPAGVLPDYEKKGGKFLVWQYKSGIKLPGEIEKQIRENYRMTEQFPEHFSVWERKSL